MNSSQISRLTLIVIVLSLSVMASVVAWPSAPDQAAWMGPSGFDYVGGTASNFPMAGGPDAGAPEIATISEIGFSGESLAVTGEGFEGASFKLWNGDQTGAVISILQKQVTATAGADRAVLTLPTGLPNATYFIWATKEDANQVELKSAPIRVNATTVTWSFPTSINRVGSTNGTLLRLFGRNLAKPGRKTYVVLEGNSTFLLDAFPSADPTLPVVSPLGDLVEPYQLDVRLPDLQAGTYQVRVYSGGGGKFGWSEPFEFEVVDGDAFGGTDVLAFNYGATVSNELDDDTVELQAAIDAAAVGGRKVRLSGGVYHVSRPLQLKEGVTLVGKSPAAYDPESRTLTVDSSVTVIRFKPYGIYQDPPECLIEMENSDSAIQGVTLLNHANGNGQKVVKISGSSAQRNKLSETTLILEDKRRWENGQLPNQGIPPDETEVLTAFPAAADIDEGLSMTGLFGSTLPARRICGFPIVYFTRRGRVFSLGSYNRPGIRLPPTLRARMAWKF